RKQSVVDRPRINANDAVVATTADLYRPRCAAELFQRTVHALAHLGDELPQLNPECRHRGEHRKNSDSRMRHKPYENKARVPDNMLPDIRPRHRSRRTDRLSRIREPHD